MPKLVVLTPAMNGLSFEVTTEKASVGRLDDNRFCVAEPSVSSHHCEVWLKGDDILVKDLDSTNGTFVNESQVAPQKDSVVRPGQVLRLGQVELRHETGKRQSDQPRQTVKLDPTAGTTIVMTKGAGFGKKENKINKIFIIVGIVLALIIVVSLVVALMQIGSGQ